MSEKSIYWSALGLVAFGASLIGCVVVPPHDGLARVHVGDVVKRIKCDIAKVVFEKAQERTPDGRTPFVFLANWAAKIHLTIAVDDTVSLNPGATILRPLDKTVATTLIPATVETFSLGIGVGGTTEAIRTEDIEFLVSFSDMITEFQKPSKRELYNNCQFDNGLFLESDLGLAPLVNSALEPIGSGVLYQGNNVGPGAAPVPIPAGQLKGIEKQLGELAKLSTIFSKIPRENLKAFSKDDLKATMQIYNEDATIEETRTQAIIKNIVQPLYTIASTSLDPSCLKKATQSQFDAITWSANVSLSVIDVRKAIDEGNIDAAEKALGAVKEARKKVTEFAIEMVKEIGVCSTEANKPKPKGPPQYDPIDLISETVNFFVTGTGSVTPTWKLVKVTAPLAPVFLSGSRKDTNTLILTMGRPAPAAGGGIMASQAMDNQILAAILSQAITNQRLGP
jgi:hypothetical protein